MRFRPPKRFGKMLPGLCAFAFLPLLFMLTYLTLPCVGPMLSRATVWSVELNFLFRSDETAGTGAAEEWTGEDGLPDNTVQSDLPADPPDTLSGETSIPAVSGSEETSDGVVSQENAGLEAQIPHAGTSSAEMAALVLPEKPAGAGSIVRKTYPQGSGGIYVSTGQATIKNCTSVSAATIRETVAQMPALQVPANGEPMVLIMHTHATESYQEYPVDWYDPSESFRTTDTQKNMCRVGDEIQKQLEAAGIGVLHDTTLHDYPSYNGAYERSAATVKQYLEQYPSIQVVLDVHRDAIQTDSTTIVAPSVTIGGKSCAQVMIISGCDDGTMNMPNYLENLKLSAALARSLEADYPGITRPVLFDYRKYNQDLTTGSILLEMGGHANTLEEAIYAGELVGKALAKTLLSLQ